MNANEREWDEEETNGSRYGSARQKERQELDRLFRETVGAVFEVSNVLGAGFLEKLYERALVKELQTRGLKAEAQVPIQVEYKGEMIGEYFADVLVEGKLIVELKCVSSLTNIHIAQCLNYLRATNRTLAMLVNFQNPHVEWKRVAFHF